MPIIVVDTAKDLSCIQMIPRQELHITLIEKKKKRSAHVKKLDYIGRVTVKNQKSQGKANDPGKHLHIH